MDKNVTYSCDDDKNIVYTESPNQEEPHVKAQGDKCKCDEVEQADHPYNSASITGVHVLWGEVFHNRRFVRRLPKVKKDHLRSSISRFLPCEVGPARFKWPRAAFNPGLLLGKL